MRPDARCHPGRRRRIEDENWKAPRVSYATTLVMCATTGVGEAVMRGVRRQQERAAGQLDEAQRAGDGRDQYEGDQCDRHLPGRPSRPGGASCRVDGL